jgi:hypothetical protein
VTTGARGAAALLTGVFAAIAWQTAPSIRASAAPDARPPVRLSDTGLYDPGRPGEIDPRNRAFAPQYPLWTDGLGKRRWIYIPPGATIDAARPDEWQFPVGTRFWKEFRKGDRKVETRFLWKAESGWVFATYAWNEDGNDARLVPDDGAVSEVEVAAGRPHVIPSRADCTACHGTESAGPLGFNALQLSTDRDSDALHGEPLTPGMLTLRELIDDGLMASPGPIDAAPRIRATGADTRRVLGYLFANCGACHDGRGGITAAAPVLRQRDLLEDGDAVVRRLIGQPTRWQVPGQPDGSSVLVHPGVPDASVLLLRLRSRAPSSQMPPLGSSVRDQAAVDAVARWIADFPQRRDGPTHPSR